MNFWNIWAYKASSILNFFLKSCFSKFQTRLNNFICPNSKITSHLDRTLTVDIVPCCTTLVRLVQQDVVFEIEIWKGKIHQLTLRLAWKTWWNAKLQCRILRHFLSYPIEMAKFRRLKMNFCFLKSTIGPSDSTDDTWQFVHSYLCTLQKEAFPDSGSFRNIHRMSVA